MSLYHVRIELREPAFELRIGPRDEPFLAGYSVTAENRDDAARRAVAKFHHDALLSSVGWTRVIQRVLIGSEPVPATVWDPEAGLGAEAAAVPEPATPVRWAAFPAEPAVETAAALPEIAPEPAIEAEPAPEAMAPATEQATWTALHTLAVVAGVGLGFYLGVKAARWRDAA